MNSSNRNSYVSGIRVKLWRSRGRRTRAVGFALIFLVVPMFLLAYLTGTLVFEITSIISLFLGVFFVFSSLESHVGSSPANVIAKSPLLTIKELIRQKGYEGKAVYVVDGDEPRVRIGDRVTNHSLLLYPPGNDLFNLIEEEVGELKDTGLDYLIEWLPRALVDALDLAEGVELKDLNGTNDEREIRALIKRPTFEGLCLSQDLKEGICDRLGCQVQGSIGQSIAISTGNSVQFKGCIYDPATRTASATYVLASATYERNNDPDNVPQNM